jgi:asparagine synthase (glutamine-hydrolysing)
LYDLLLDATRIRLRAHVPVAAYLSGGLDSSIISAIAHGIIGSSLNTFSVSFEDPAFDESQYQLTVAQSLGTRHHSISCSAMDIARAFPDVIRHTERPVLRTAPAPLLLLSRLVRENGFKVVLTGEGADEFFGGYDIYKEAKVRAFWGAQPDSKTRPLLLKRLYPYLSDVQRQPLPYLQAFFRVRPEDMANPLFSHVPRWQLTSRLHMLFSRDLREQLAKDCLFSELTEALPSGFEKWPMFSRAQYLESAFLLPQYLLSSQGDRVAMANSVEGRYPFLDHRVVQFCASLPVPLRMKVLDEKYLLKQTFGKLIPDAVKQRPKQPYRAPDAASFYDARTGQATEKYVEDLLSPEALKRNGIFDSREVGRAVEKARQGQTAGFLPNAALVGIISTQLTIDQFISSSKETLSYATN